MTPSWSPRRSSQTTYDDGIDCERCVQLVTPIAEHIALPIDSTFGYNPWVGGNGKAAVAVKESLRATRGQVLVAWEHVNIQFLIEALGVDKSKVPSWPDSDYDTVSVLKFDSLLNLISFKASAQNFHRNSRMSGSSGDLGGIA